MPVHDLKETISYYRNQLGFSDEWFLEDTDAESGEMICDYSLCMTLSLCQA